MLKILFLLRLVNWECDRGKNTLIIVFCWRWLVSFPTYSAKTSVLLCSAYWSGENFVFLSVSFDFQ